MSELAPGSLSLDEDQSAQIAGDPPEPTPETPAEPQQATPVVDDQEPEGTIVNPNGEKLVPLSALAAKRQEASTAKAALAEKEAKIAELEQKAQQFEQLKGDWQRVQPLIQQIQQQQQAPPPPPKPAGPLSPQDAIDYARDLDLYKADGTPDVDRAQRLALRQQAIAQTTAQQAVQPLYQNSAQQQSANMRYHAGQQKGPNGQVVDPRVLDQIWGMVPVEMSARPEVAGMLWRQALAETLINGTYKPPVTAPPPPQHTESLGGNTSAPKELSALDRQMMSAGQIKSKDYETISSNFKPGQTNVLE